MDSISLYTKFGLSIASTVSELWNLKVPLHADSGRYLLTDTPYPHEFPCEVGSLYDKGLLNYEGLKFP